ncbi:hypothetical protein RUM43_012624 [Polyplax serrata]|uniref:Uncharacterized protein n=1 Tax=Polyplax serrata TaxID=468196 RepID=A0AAN8PHX6_POLSC
MNESSAKYPRRTGVPGEYPEYPLVDIRQEPGKKCEGLGFQVVLDPWGGPTGTCGKTGNAFVPQGHLLVFMFDRSVCLLVCPYVCYPASTEPSGNVINSFLVRRVLRLSFALTWKRPPYPRSQWECKTCFSLIKALGSKKSP